MTQDTIRELEDLLGEFLGPHRVITKSEISRLTAPGENYGSVMLKLDITLKDKRNGTEETLHTVAKKIPEGEVMQAIFNIQVTYRNEVGWYAEIVPLLRNFQKELNVDWLIDCSPAIYGSRFNLDDSSQVDYDAAFILENLQVSGFVNIDRIKGFDLETTKLVLRSLSEFHAVPLALKLKHPLLFEEKIKSHCTRYKLIEDDKVYDYLIFEILKEVDEFKSLIPKIHKFFDQKTFPPREPFATVVHNDIWTNNTMQKFENDKPVANKFVDFQLLGYDSPATDLFFFLMSSVQQSVLETHLDDLIKYYYDNFVTILKEHQCDVTPFSFEAFVEEIRMESKYEIAHSMIFAVITVNAKKGSKIKIDEQPTVESLMKYVTDQAKKRVWYIAETCMKRGWY